MQQGYIYHHSDFSFIFFFYQSDFVLDFLAFPSLLLVALTLGSGASVSRMLMVGTILGLVPLDEEIKAEMKYIIPKGFFPLFLHSNTLTSKSTMLNFTTPSFFTRSLSILRFLKHLKKINNKILSLLFGFFPTRNYKMICHTCVINSWCSFHLNIGFNS